MGSRTTALKAIATLRDLQHLAARSRVGESIGKRVEAQCDVDKGRDQLTGFERGWHESLGHHAMDPETNRRWASAWLGEDRAQETRLELLGRAQYDEERARRDWHLAEQRRDTADAAHRHARRREEAERQEHAHHDIADRHLHRARRQS